MIWSRGKLAQEKLPSEGAPHRSGKLRRLLRVPLTTAVAVGVGLTLAAGSAVATQAAPTTNDQSTTINTAWWTYTGVTATQVGSLLSANSARLTQIRVENPVGPVFDVTMVSNSGAYASGWWWYYGLTASQVSSTLSTNNARLISLEPYVVSGSLYFAVVEVPNAGAQARAWWWYYGQSASGIASTLSTNNSRLVSLQPYQIGGTTSYAVIEISNSGVDFADYGWWYSFNQTPAQIANQAQTDGARLIAMAADPGGGFDTIYLGSEGEGWWWYYGEPASTLVNLMLNNGARLIDITPYVSGGQTVYAGVGIDNSNVLQNPINASSTKVEELRQRQRLEWWVVRCLPGPGVLCRQSVGGLQLRLPFRAGEHHQGALPAVCPRAGAGGPRRPVQLVDLLRRSQRSHQFRRVPADVMGGPGQRPDHHARQRPAAHDVQQRQPGDTGDGGALRHIERAVDGRWPRPQPQQSGPALHRLRVSGGGAQSADRS